MRISDGRNLIAVLAVGVAVFVTPAAALDSSVKIDPDANPWAVFKLGYSAYQKGEKEKAIEAYRFAAERGHAGARWKLAQMYAQGDGVKPDEYEAFRMFEDIVQQGADPGSPDAAFVSSALVELGNYLCKGIPGTPVHENKDAARELYSQAALNFGNSEAQFRLGRMLYDGEGGPENQQQAGRWFSLAAQKGHAGAEAMLGNILFQSGRIVKGLAMLTDALERATARDRAWIQEMQERAFSLAPEAERRTAVAVADDMRAGKN
jgi:TPR repeat protein